MMTSAYPQGTDPRIMRQNSRSSYQQVPVSMQVQTPPKVVSQSNSSSRTSLHGMVSPTQRVEPGKSGNSRVSSRSDTGASPSGERQRSTSGNASHSPRMSPVDQRIPSPKPRYGYQPHHANNVVFEEKKPMIGMNTLNNMRMFGKSKAEKSKIRLKQQSSVMYQHRQGSDDSLELMPTLAIGYENSMDKRLKKNNGELRITSDGYYFEQFEDEDDEVDVYGDYDGSEEQLEEPVLESESPVVRAEPAKDVPTGYIAEPVMTSAPYPSALPLEKLEIPKVRGSPKRQKLFKKIFRSRDKVRNRAEVPQAYEIPSDHLEQAQQAQQHIQHTQQAQHHIQNTQQEQHIQHTEHIANADLLPEHASFVDLVNSIPVVSQVFTMIDESDALSVQAKLLLKLLLIVWMLYEVQCLVEALTGWAGTS